jgi:hypothetical protein
MTSFFSISCSDILPIGGKEIGAGKDLSFRISPKVAIFQGKNSLYHGLDHGFCMLPVYSGPLYSQNSISVNFRHLVKYFLKHKFCQKFLFFQEVSKN